MIAEGISDTLVISDGLDPGWVEAVDLCKSRRAICFTPDPYSTQGEARWIAQEAKERGWDSVVVVTSTYHVRRTRMIVERCFHGDLAVVGAQPPVRNGIIGVAWEWPKSIYYLTLNRGC